MPGTRFQRFALLALILSLLAAPNILFGDPIPLVVTPDTLDSAAFTAWVGGQTQAVMKGQGVGATPATDGPRHIVWTTSTVPVWDGASFGESAAPGPRYLRIGFTHPLTVGSVLVRAGGALSVLKPGAAYPGRIDNDADWIPATRIVDDTVSAKEADHETYAVWTLPPGTVTRALRFEHTPDVADSDYAGWIGGVQVLSTRCTNIAPLGKIYTSIDNDHAALINDTTNNGTWGAWDNGDQGDSVTVSASHPNDIMVVWPKAVSVSGLCALWAGFDTGDVSYLAKDVNPRTAPDTDWQLVTSFSGFQNGYPLGLYPNWIDLGKPVYARALRLRITSSTQESHPHLYGKTYGGKRIWLGELMALTDIGSKGLSSVLSIAAPPTLPHPPIPIKFHLDKPGFVTLVIDHKQGVRVRNLVSETHFPAGNNVVWWDGLDDRGRDTDASSHAVYFVPGQLVPAGNYVVHGLVRQQIDLHYLMTAYTNGHPAWQTQSASSQWLANHTPPQSALYIPESDTSLTPAGETPGGLMLIGSYVTEGGSGLAWLTMDGDKKHGEGWIGGNWTGAPFLARDNGDRPIPGTYAYVASAFDSDLRLTALTKNGDSNILSSPYTLNKNISSDDQLSGIAVRNGLLAASLGKANQLLFVDISKQKLLGTIAVNDPRGVAFDSSGKLLVLSGKTLIRCVVSIDQLKLDSTQTLVSSGLDDPQQLALDAAGLIYISDRGQSQQVKVFDTAGSPVRTIGHAGPSVAGPYDPQHMNSPAGISVDSAGRLWVAENTFQPKRVSIWAADGSLVRAFYGPPLYGGGGELDPRDPNAFYYCGMKFKLDYNTGGSWPVDIYYLSDPSDPYQSPSALSGPQTPIYINNREYLTNCYNSNPTNGSSIAAIWLLDHGIARAVAAMGIANNVDLLKTDTFKPDWPAGVNSSGDYWQNQAVFYWWDKNGDGKMEPDEVTILKQTGGGVTVSPNLSFVESRVDGAVTQFSPNSYTSAGAPEYSFTGKTVVIGAQGPVSTGGDQALLGAGGWTICTNAMLPFSQYGVGGAKNGKPLWSYPSLWPGLHASHNAPLADHPGELLGTTRLLGGFVTPHGSDAGQIWAINGNFGNVYLMTADGLFVATLFKDCRTASWSMPAAQKNMLVDDVSLGGENFWPTITQETDGSIYLTGLVSCISRIDGLQTIRRLPASSIKVTAADLADAQAYFEKTEEIRQSSQDQDTMTVPIKNTPPNVDGKLDSWSDADWVTIDLRTNQIGDWGHSEQKITGTLEVSGDQLYVAYNTSDPRLLENAGGALPLFKTGGALDLMLTGQHGIERLLVTTVAGRTKAVLYRPHDPAAAGQPVSFSSPLRTIKFDTVKDISDQVVLAADGAGIYEYSVPLAALDLTPLPGQTIKGDIGLLRGNGFTTLQRVYWRNKATGLVSDVPSEAELTPNLWGDWKFTN